MFNNFDTKNKENSAEDTALPEDLLEHLERRKIDRLELISKTDAVSRFFIGWSLNATGFFIARWLLLIGGSTNLWIAATLCFTVSATSSFASLSNVSANFKGGVEIEGGEKLIKAITGFGLSGGVTLIACKDFLHYQHISNTTIEEIKQDIQDIQSPSFWASNWAYIPILVILAVLAIKFLGGKKNV